MTDDVDPRDDDERGGAAGGATPDATETVRFGLDGVVHEIDLAPADARALHAALAPYVAAGRHTTVTITPIHDEPARAAGVTAGTAPTGERAAARAWLEANGHKLGPGGRISATLMTLYRGRDGR
ncbi:Lsr2 dimerization domain-containing protein [Clavibacter sepedonicus]|uniref:Lsr2-like protein n=1 Tax=Clavibacter sepedonicus TaxID=31964 RepID=B0RF66_CLASE|nr:MULTISPECIES: histone-like nucleoid-structuring protein Lsr2 [Clavibacter]MBD5382826.1 Lsr2 family protein [Clavibacter sp.]OQJ49351.1 transcriptional regulator, histone-like protein [Clavibacter sepedonicus]OQJ54966.1 transcriptional regulator, histone-like protein [Clavibacter sepedonicus]UUK64796.1 Lsr2 family protein [Clavibacter sepedonicus]CAQ00999.1 putative Lsr2-like protein [Clavibacter sepedonicus]